MRSGCFMRGCFLCGSSGHVMWRRSRRGGSFRFRRRQMDVGGQRTFAEAFEQVFAESECPLQKRRLVWLGGCEGGGIFHGLVVVFLWEGCRSVMAASGLAGHGPARWCVCIGRTHPMGRRWGGAVSAALVGAPWRSGRPLRLSLRFGVCGGMGLPLRYSRGSFCVQGDRRRRGRGRISWRCVGMKPLPCVGSESVRAGGTSGRLPGGMVGYARIREAGVAESSRVLSVRSICVTLRSCTVTVTTP